MAFYDYAQARVHILRDEYDLARNALEVALEILPDYEPAVTLLNHLTFVTRTSDGFRRLFERQERRDKARRIRLQAKLTTAAPSLSEALPLYSREVLTAMGRRIMPWGGWSSLRKAELVQELVRRRGEPETVRDVLAQLDDTERRALGEVLANGARCSGPTFPTLTTWARLLSRSITSQRRPWGGSASSRSSSRRRWTVSCCSRCLLSFGPCCGIRWPEARSSRE